MIHKIDKGDYYLIKSDTGKLRIKGDDRIYSEAVAFENAMKCVLLANEKA